MKVVAEFLFDVPIPPPVADDYVLANAEEAGEKLQDQLALQRISESKERIAQMTKIIEDLQLAQLDAKEKATEQDLTIADLRARLATHVSANEEEVKVVFEELALASEEDDGEEDVEGSVAAEEATSINEENDSKVDPENSTATPSKVEETKRLALSNSSGNIPGG
jgi:hypothetical protein